VFIYHKSLKYKHIQ